MRACRAFTTSLCRQSSEDLSGIINPTLDRSITLCDGPVFIFKSRVALVTVFPHRTFFDGIEKQEKCSVSAGTMSVSGVRSQSIVRGAVDKGRGGEADAFQARGDGRNPRQDHAAYRASP